MILTYNYRIPFSSPLCETRGRNKEANCMSKNKLRYKEYICMWRKASEMFRMAWSTLIVNFLEFTSKFQN